MNHFPGYQSTLSVVLMGLVVGWGGPVWAVQSKTASTTSKASIVCWTDASGQKSCGNSLPANLAGSAHEQVGTDGIVRDRVAAAATPGEIAAQQAAQQQAAASALAAAAQKQQDSFIHDRYQSRADIAKEFDQQRMSKKAAMALVVSDSRPLQKTLVQRLNQAARLEDEHKKIPPNLDRLIEEARSEILSGEKNLAAQQAELAELDTQQAATEAAWDRAEKAQDGPAVVSVPAPALGASSSTAAHP